MEKRKTTEFKTTKKKTCAFCSKELTLNNFYYTNGLSKDKLTHICKACIIQQVDYNDKETIYKVLKLIDRVFLIDFWDRAEKDHKGDPNLIGQYLKRISSIPSVKNMTFDQSVFRKNSSRVEKDKETKNIPKSKDKKFKITNDIIERWGENYQDHEYQKLENFYHNMCRSNRIESAQEESYLKKLAITSMKMDVELESGNYIAAKSLGDLFSKYMADSKFRAIDQSDATRQGGVRTFSQIYAEVEKDGFIPVWETYRVEKGLSQDIVDKTIMYILNYTLKLNKMTQLVETPLDAPRIDGDENV